MAGKIVVKGARVHNLKNIDLEIPRDRLVVITGVSGSGKSSLAFDTLYAEGQRRYLESLGADARQLLRQLAKPDVDLISGLSPAIAIEQKISFASPRSTVGTMTDIYDFLRLLFARAGQSYCPDCGSEITARTIDQIVDQLLTTAAESRVMVLAPVVLAQRGGAAQSLQELMRQGFTRVIVDGSLYELNGDIPEPVQNSSRLDLVVDRLVLRQGAEKRLADSLELAARAGKQIVKVALLDDAPGGASQELVFSLHLACVVCGAAAPEISTGLFSFNSPRGACDSCHGLGVDTQRGKSKTDTRLCSACGGSRLNPASLSVRIADKNIAELAALSVRELRQFLAGLELAADRRVVGAKIIFEIESRLACLVRLGLEYLSLDRGSTTLSGGEAQRVRLATQIGVGLSGVLYILDEPSIGLHQRDNARLIELLKLLRDGGNTVIVVEHDAETIEAADYVIDMGPAAGEIGGAVVACGLPSELGGDPRSLTGRYLAGTEAVAIPRHRRSGVGVLQASNLCARNLNNLSVEIPIGALTCVTGVSGAGKTTLVMEVLFDGVSQRLRRRRGSIESEAHISGWQHFDRAIGIDQAPIGRSPRANPATYVGLYDHLRELYAQLPEARVRGYRADRFSFNLRGGRCEACQGDGIVHVEMQFLPELAIPCEACQGRRYNRETLAIKYKGLSIAEMLDLSVDQALDLLGNVAPIGARLRTLREVGLSYLRLGQSTATLSGGEAQRVKLARELARQSSGRSLYVLDEPTTGLHFDDVRKLLELLERLVEQGNTMIIVEHNLDVIKCADYVIDLGPEGGAKGGRVIAAGPPETIAQCAESVTGHYLKAVLGGAYA
jgi:excinuclease ABC subunit A